MPFGLSGAPSSFQRLMDKILRGLPFVTIYLDNILVHSIDKATHCHHLREVFKRLANAGLTLRGKKCHIRLTTVSYLGHVFSNLDMIPDPKKVQAVQEWPTPTDATEVRRFLGLASYYRRYISHFLDIAAPLNALTQKGVQFVVTKECMDVFAALKQHLVQVPVLAYSRFDPQASEFMLQTDASAVGLGAVLEQDGHVIAYASRSLTPSERQYSVIQRECLVVVYALKHFRHYLLGRRFQLLTDHVPLQWLSAQKMEDMLCRWALAMQEYDFQIVYRKGSLNANADALSRLQSSHTCAAAVAMPHYSPVDLRTAQQHDSTISKIHRAHLQDSSPPHGQDWNQHPLKRYRQSKLSRPQRAPLTNMPIGLPWQMLAVDILAVPLSTNNNRNLLVIQDYFTKWVEAVPLPDQTADRITGELVKLFSTYGHPEILHSDQGRNFESSILAQTLDAFGVHKSRTTAYHPQGDGMVERFNRSLLQLLRTYVDTQDD